MSWFLQINVKMIQEVDQPTVSYSGPFSCKDRPNFAVQLNNFSEETRGSRSVSITISHSSIIEQSASNEASEESAPISAEKGKESRVNSRRTRPTLKYQRNGNVLDRLAVQVTCTPYFPPYSHNHNWHFRFPTDNKPPWNRKVSLLSSWRGYYWVWCLDGRFQVIPVWRKL